MPANERKLTPARRASARKAWETRRSPRYRAAVTERASKTALSEWCANHGWRVVFFEGATGAPRTGIVDAVMVRIAPGKADYVDIRLVQLKAGAGGMTAAEVRRMKAATSQTSIEWVLAAYDSEELHFLSESPSAKRRNVAKAKRA